MKLHLDTSMIIYLIITIGIIQTVIMILKSSLTSKKMILVSIIIFILNITSSFKIGKYVFDEILLKINNHDTGSPIILASIAGFFTFLIMYNIISLFVKILYGGFGYNMRRIKK